MTQPSEKSLTKRYLFWLYKTTRDELDRIDRKFTQLEVDRGLQRVFRSRGNAALSSFMDEWDRYIVAKEADARKLKFDEQGKELAFYVFLRLKLESVIEITRERFGIRAVRQFEQLIEEAAMKYILEDASGKR